MSGVPLVVAWAAQQPRTSGLARDLGGEAAFVTSPLPPRPVTAPLRYLWCAVRTWRLLERRRPACVLVVAPPVVAPLLAAAWCAWRGRPLVVDCHTGTFHARRWAWAQPLYRWLLPRCRAVLAHTDEATALLRAWGAPGLLMPDDLPDAPPTCTSHEMCGLEAPESAHLMRCAVRSGAEASPSGAGAPPPPQGGRNKSLLVAGSLDENEPVAEALAAARLLPDVAVRVTGDPGLVPRDVRASAPPNVTFTGFLPLPGFLDEMRAADVVAVFSTDPHIMNRAAFEAVGLGRPLVLSDLPGLRGRFGPAALFAENRPDAMAGVVRDALASRSDLERRSQQLAVELRRQHAEAVARLRGLVAGAPRQRVLRITQHPFPADSIVRRDVLELTSRGIEVDVVCAASPDRDDPLPEGPSAPRVHRLPIRHRRGGVARYALEYTLFFVSAFAVASVLGLRRRYAAVQADNLPDLLVLAGTVPRLRGARLVLTMYELAPEMVAARFQGRLGRALHGVARAMEAVATRWADHVIVISRPCLEILEHRGVPVARTSVVLNTTPWHGPRPVPAPERAAAWTLVTHGTLVERYGVHIAVRALSLLRPSWPGLSLRVVGGGEQLPELARLARDLGLDDRVAFTGPVPWSEALAEVGRARLGLVPILADGYGQLLLPTKLLEYAWLGIPAVSSRLPAIEAYFPPGTVAYARPGDPESLAAEIDRLLRQPAEAEAQAGRAAEVARELAWERMRERYLTALGLDPAPLWRGRATSPSWDA